VSVISLLAQCTRDTNLHQILRQTRTSEVHECTSTCQTTECLHGLTPVGTNQCLRPCCFQHTTHISDTLKYYETDTNTNYRLISNSLAKSKENCFGNKSNIQCESKEVAPPPKTFCNIFTQVKYISVKFCQCVASLYLQYLPIYQLPITVVYVIG